MPCWYYEKEQLRNTPSIQDGIEYETEQRYRKEGARFIINVGTKMDLGYSTMATGVVYFHRFYMFHSFRQFPRYVTACCCLFLAGKVEETPKKCKDIIKTAKDLLSDLQFRTFGEDPKEEVMTLERILLQTIKFDLQVEHPYSYLLKYAKCLKGDKNKLQKMVQMAWTFVNDSLCTTLCLQWEPEVIAVALMYLSGKLSKFEVQDWSGRTSKHLRWWDMFVEDVTLDLLEGICHQVLDLYSPQQTSNIDSPPLQPRSPNAKKHRAEQPSSPVLHHSPMPSVIPAKGTKMEPMPGPPPPAAVGSNDSIPLSDKTEVPLQPMSGDTAAFPHSSSYGHGTAVPPPAFPSTFSTPISVQNVTPASVPTATGPPHAPHVPAAPPHLPAAPPPAYPPYPPQFPPGGPPGQFFTGGAPTRPYYPPPGAS